MKFLMFLEIFCEKSVQLNLDVNKFITFRMMVQ